MSLPAEVRALIGVHLLYSKIEEAAESVNVDPPLSKNERRCLINLDAPQRMGVLADKMLALPSTVTATSDDLERKGLLRRRRDPEDRRAWLLELTDEGEVARDELLSLAVKLFRETSGLTQPEIHDFAKLVTKTRTAILKTGIPEGVRK